MVGADITQFRKGMRDIRNETGILSETLAGIAGVGRSMTFALTTPILTMGTYFAQAATEFDANMRNINSLVKLSQGDFQDLSTEVLNFGMNSRAGANAASEALYAVFSAGYGLDDTSKAMDVMEYSTMLAEAGLSGLERTTEGLTATMLTFNDGTLDIARATDVWANMVGFGVGNLEGFLMNANKAMPAANALGVSFENLGATAAFLSQGFASPNKAMTAIGMLESNLMKPNAALALSYEKLGVVTGQQLVAKFGSLEEAIIAIKGVTNDIEFAAGFSKTGMEAALLLTNNIDATRAAYEAFYEGLDGAAFGQWQQQTQSFAYQFDRFKSALQGVAIALGNQVLPLITPLIAHITDGLVWFAQLNPEVHRFAVLLGGVTAAIGPVLWVFGSLIGTLTPMGLLFKGIIAAVSAFSSNFLGLRDTIASSTSGIIGSLAPLSETINTFYETLFPDTIEPPDTDALTGNWVNEVNTAEFLKIEGPTNLWTIFKEQGYEDLFSWDEFRDMAYKGGWDGQALQGDEIISLGGDLENAFTTVQKTKSQMQAMLDGGLVDPKGPVIPSTFTERFTKALQTALPSVIAELGNVLTGIRKWADANIGQGLNFLANLFAGSNDSNGNTPIYKALQQALNGDIIGAIDAVIPGAGEHLRNFLGTDFGNQIYNAFPQISAGISNLLTNAGQWFMDEGVPTLSRSVGYIVGKVGIAFGEVLGNLWGNLTNGNAAKGAGNAASVLGDTVVNPALQGFNDAMKEGGVTDPINQLFTALSGALVTAAGAWVIGVGFKEGIFAAIKFAISGMLSFAIWAGGWALNIIGKLGAALVAKSGLAAAWGTASTAITDGLKTLMTTATSGISSATSWVLSSAGSVIKALGAAIIASPISAGIVLGTLLYIAIPEEFKQGMRDAFKNVVDTIFGEGTTSYLNDAVHDAVILGISTAMYAAGDTEGAKNMAAGLSGGTNLVAPVTVDVEPEFWSDGFDLTTEQGQKDFMHSYFPEVLDIGEISVDGKFAFNEIKAGIDEQYLEYFSPDAIANALAQGITWDEYQKQIDNIAIEAYDLIGQKMVEKGAEFTLPDTLPVINLEGIDIGVTSATINTEGATVTMADPTTLIPDNSDTIVTYITPDGQVLDQKLTDANTTLTDGVTALGMTIANNIGDGTNLDANKIFNEFLQPLESHFVTTFGPESTITTTMTNFGTTLATKFTEVGTTLATANTDVATKLGQITLSFITEFDKIALAIQNGMDKINDWNLTVSGMSVAPSMAGGVDGSHAGGLRSVPYDGYIAELHKGERVLTKEEAQDYGTVPSSAIVSKPANSGGETIVNQTFVFNEVMSANRMVREMNRVGYRVEKR